LKDILKKMNDGVSDPRTMSRDLGISIDQLMASIDTMVRMGYLDQVDGSSGTCGGSSLCVSCPSASKGDCSMLETRTYYITEKGQRALR